MGSERHIIATAIAHSPAEPAGRGQPIVEHLQNVAGLAEQFGRACGISEAAHLAGLWHDLGKASEAFQEKLTSQPRKKVGHKSVGTFHATQKQWNDVAFVIEGHHGGLPDKTELKTILVSPDKSAWEKTLCVWQRERPDILESGKPDCSRLSGGKRAFELHVRMLFSCLIDADFLDTEAFLQPEKAKLRKPEWPALDELARRFFDNQAVFVAHRRADPDKDERLFNLRCHLYEEAVGKAERKNGVYSMAIPTGGGKTRTALGFAFRHALHNRQRRIIVALPYTSILDQMAGEYRAIFGDESFLEHHSSWQPPQGKDEEGPEVRRMMLACENWDASLILTTTVQLFDSLFSNRVSDCRKLHNIADSVIVLDEVQTLPVRYLEPICDMLAELVRSYNVTVLLSTATQPALDRVKSFVKPEPLIAQPEVAFTILKRVNYQVELDTPWEWDRVADELMAEPSGMAIVNLKRHAVELFDVLCEKAQKVGEEETCFHLSTFLCSAHRKDVIEKIRTRLKKGKPCRLVSTQVVEAGVDLDFPLVLRAVGPLDRVVQAAGRCNREAKMQDKGKVIVFKPAAGGMPKGEYETGTGIFGSIASGGTFNPHDPQTFESYFGQLFNRRNLDEEGIQDKRERLLFEEVAQKFHLIEDGGLKAILVGYGGMNNQWESSPALQLVGRLAEAKGDSRRAIFRQLQAYTVQTYAKEFDKLRGRLVLESSVPELYYWCGSYHAKLGIAAGQLDIDAVIL